MIRNGWMGQNGENVELGDESWTQSILGASKLFKLLTTHSRIRFILAECCRKCYIVQKRKRIPSPL